MALRSTAPVSGMVAKTLVCIDGVENADWYGRIYSPYMMRTCSFSGFKDFIDTLDNFFDSVGYPQSTYALRSFFTQRENRKKNVEICLDGMGGFPDCRGRLATFHLHVILRNNATWQGSIRRIDGSGETCFASVLELARFLDGAVRN